MRSAFIKPSWKHRGWGHSGFTLLEIMIVCSLVALLMALAIPSYQQYILRTHRTAAIEQLLAAVACQQQLYASVFSFDSNQCLPESKDGRYAYRYEPEGAAGLTAFRIVAEPVAAQSSDKCGNLSLDHRGQKLAEGSPERQQACWQSR